MTSKKGDVGWDGCHAGAARGGGWQRLPMQYYSGPIRPCSLASSSSAALRSAI